MASPQARPTPNEAAPRRLCTSALAVVALLGLGCGNMSNGIASTKPVTGSEPETAPGGDDSGPADEPELTAPRYGYRVVSRYPHDKRAFTQGLEFHAGKLYEGTGKYGESTLRRVDLESGRVEQSAALMSDLFGEGITIFNGKIYQLTWQSRVGFIYDLESMELEREFRYSTQGWGMTHDDDELIVSDGSSFLYFWDPETLRETKRLEVTFDGRPVTALNELEYIDGEIFANIWQLEKIARISPNTGEVRAWIELEGLYQPRQPGEDVLNGIAHLAKGNRLFVTGKLWPEIFEIELVPKDDAE